MSDPIDDLLAQLQSSRPDASKSAPSSMNSQPPPPTNLPINSIDGLLDDLDEKPAKRPQDQPIQPSTNPKFDALVQPVVHLPDLDQPISNPPRQTGAATDNLTDNLTANLLADIKALYQEQDQTAALQQQAEQAAEQRRQETLSRQRRGELVRQAETWLKNLDARSGEAAWFEEFAAKYSSRVEAAIEYLNLEAQS